MKKIKITPKPEHDQNFLINTKIIKDIIKAIKTEATSKKSPVFKAVLEIGPGTGTITKELALNSKQLIAVEIDKSLSATLSSLPKNVTVKYYDALEYLKDLKQKIQDKKKGDEKNKAPIAFPFDLVFSSLPYKICEPTLKALSIMPGFNMGFFIVPHGFYKKLKESIYFESFFNITHILDIPKESFNPIPKSDSCLIKVTKKDSLKINLLPSKKASSKNPHLKAYNIDININFILQKLLSQRTKKAKNALRDAIIDFSKLKCYEYSTKKLAETLILKLDLSPKILDTTVYSLSTKELKAIKEKITKELLV